ncbi:MAG: PAS domain S-box protein [Thermodesulfobacteriota bacterium]
MSIKKKSYFNNEVSITSGLLFYIVTIIGITTFLIIAALYLLLTFQADKEINKKIREYFVYIETSIERPLWLYEEESLVRTAENFFNSSPVVELEIYDSAEKKYIYKNSVYNDSETVSYKNDIVYQGKKIGFIKLSLSREDFYSGIYKNLAALAGIVVFITLCLVLFIVVFVQRFLKKPLDKMFEGIKALSGGDYDYRFGTFKQKEFSQIAGSFNEMADTVKQREKDLKESEKRFKNLADSTSAGIMVYQDNKWIYANPAAQRMSGYSMDELKKMNFWEIADLSFAESIKEKGEKRQKNIKAESGYEALIRCRNNEKRWALIEGDSVEYMGKTSGLISVIDITERKEAEHRIISAWTFVEDVINSMPSVIISVDSDLKIRLWNKKAEERTGVPAEKAVGKSVEDIFYHLDMKEFGIRKAIEFNEVQKLERRKSEKEKKTVYEDIAVYPVASEDFKGAVIRIDDVTDRVKLDEALMDAETIKNISRAKSEFLANMSHEIRTPLNGVIGMSSVALDSCPDDQQKRYLEIIKSSAESLLILINDILDFSKIDSGRMEVDSVNFSFRNIINSCAERFKRKSEEKNIEFIHFYDSFLPETLKGDFNKLNRVLANILGNAVKFTSSGSIEFRVIKKKEDEDKVFIQFIIKDTGIGIPGEKLKSLFRPFMQVDGSYTRKYQGAGLGLAISYQLVKILGGDISVDSSPDQGSVFEIVIPFKKSGAKSVNEKMPSDFVPAENYQRPLVVGDISSDEKNTQEKDLKDDKAGRVLLAEDNPVNQSIFMKYLQKIGVNADCVSNGKECIEKLEQGSYDLVLMDCQMPEMDGYEASSRIKNQKTKISDIPVIIALTAHTGDGHRNKCLQAGMDDYISKPVDMEKLKNILMKWM